MKLYESAQRKCVSFIPLPSIILHLLQLLRGESCQLRTSLLQSIKLHWTQDCGYELRTETKTSPVPVLNTYYIICSKIYNSLITCLAQQHTHTHSK